MAEFEQVVETTIDTLVKKARDVAADKKTNWAVGFRASYNHDFQEDKHGEFKIAVEPGAPLPVSVGLEAGIQQQVHDTTNLQIYFLFSSQQAPTIDRPGSPIDSGVPVPPFVPAPGPPAIPEPGNANG
jgi:hypothetical protein